MAAVVTTTTINRKTVWGDDRVVDATLAFDTGDYAAGGVAITASQFGLQAIRLVIPATALEVSATPTAQIVRWNPTTSKLEVYQAGANAGDPFPEKGAEAFGAGASVRVLVIGY